MPFTFSHPLLLGALLPAGVFCLCWFLLRLRVGKGPKSVLLGLRLLVLLGLALALGGLGMRGAPRPLPRVYLLDVSESGRHARGESLRLLRESVASLEKDRPYGIVAFAREAEVARGIAPGPLDEAGLTKDLERMVGKEATDAGKALRQALALLDPEGGGDLVWIGDGRDTEGGGGRAAADVASRGIALHVLRGTSPDPADARVESLEVPRGIAPGKAFAARIVLSATVRARAIVELTARRGWLREGGTGEVRLAEASVSLDRGGSVPVSLEAVLPPGWGGEIALRARLKETIFLEGGVAGEAPADSFPGNDAVEGSSIVEETPRVLVVGSAEGAPGWVEALRAAPGLDVETAGPGDLEKVRETFARYAAVVIQDVSWEEARGAAPDLDAAVERGVGLVLAGARKAFGPGGYPDTELDRISPVRARPKAKEGLDLVLVLDRSHSMGDPIRGPGDEPTTKLALLKTAARQAVRELKEKDRLEVITFSAEVDPVAFPLGEAASPDGASKAEKAIDAIAEGTRTSIIPKGRPGPLERAIADLGRSDRSRIRHILFISDGGENRSDLPQLVSDLEDRVLRVLGEEKITLTVISTGSKPEDEPVFKRLDEEKGLVKVIPLAGRVAQLPAEILKDVRDKQNRGLLQEGEFAVTVKAKGGPVPEATAALGAVSVYARAELKDGADLYLLAGPEKDPLLSAWRVGLGRVAALTTDPFVSKWETADRTQLLRGIATWVLREPLPPNWTIKVEGREGRTYLVLFALTEDGKGFENGMRPRVTVRPEGAATELRQVEPGRYEAPIPSLSPGVHPVEIRPSDSGGARLLPLAVPYPPELLRVGADERALDALAETTAGRVATRPADLPPPPQGRSRSTDLTGPAAFGAAIFFLLAVAATAVGGVQKY